MIPKIDWNAIPWTTVRPGVERKGFTGAGATVALHRLHPGHEPKPHSHPNEQIVYIMAGTIESSSGRASVYAAAASSERAVSRLSGRARAALTPPRTQARRRK